MHDGVLDKAKDDTWYYLLCTKNGELFVFGLLEEFEDDSEYSEYFMLCPIDEGYIGADSLSPYFFDVKPDRIGPVFVVPKRGVMMRKDHIAWVVDGQS